jgi:hypothetical protein
MKVQSRNLLGGTRGYSKKVDKSGYSVSLNQTPAVYKSRALSLSLVFILFSWGGWGWVHLARRPLTDLLYQPRMIDEDDCGAVGVMIIGTGNRSTRRKPAPVSLCPSQIRHDLTWVRTRATAMGSRRLTAWAMVRPALSLESACHVWNLCNFSKADKRIREGNFVTMCNLLSCSCKCKLKHDVTWAVF